MTTNVKKVILSHSGKEIHFPIGNSVVAVCWNVNRVEKQIKGEDGLIYTAKVYERKKNSKAYIDFITLHEDEDEYIYEDEESPVEGGLNINYAEKIANEIVRAVQYARSLE